LSTSLQAARAVMIFTGMLAAQVPGWSGAG
jgi:hypothetical protein